MKIKILIILITGAAAIALPFMFKNQTISHGNQNYEKRDRDYEDNSEYSDEQHTDDQIAENIDNADSEEQTKNQPDENSTQTNEQTGSAQPTEEQTPPTDTTQDPPLDHPVPNPTPNPQPNPTPSPSPSGYTLHENITATVFWVGEPQGGGSSEDNALSAWDDHWQGSFGGFDDPENRNGYFPVGFTPKENPFYLDVPYNDFDDNGDRRSNAFDVVPWANQKSWGDDESLMKNRWVRLVKDGKVCYGQIEDSGPYEYDDVDYVFGTAAPKSTLANSAGLDVSPALRDCLGFEGVNNDSNRVDWQFVEASEVPAGPWEEIVTTSQINW